MSIAVEDWDDLVDEPRPRGRRGRQPEHRPAPAREPVSPPDPSPPPAPVAVVEPAPAPAPVAAFEPAPASLYEAAPAPAATPVSEPAVSAVWEPAPFREPRPLHAVHAPVAEPEAEPEHEHEHELTELRAVETVPETSPLRAQSAAAKPSPMRARIAARAPSAVAPADLVGDWDELERKPARAKAALPAPEPPPEVDMGTANFSDDHYGDTHENLRIPAGIAGANALFWLVGRMFGVVELVGVAFFVAIGLLLAAYVMREWQRDRTALICIAGALPLPLTIISLFV